MSGRSAPPVFMRAAALVTVNGRPVCQYAETLTCQSASAPRASPVNSFPTATRSWPSPPSDDGCRSPNRTIREPASPTSSAADSGMRQRVMRVERQARAIPPLEHQLHRVVVRLALIEEDGDVADVRVDRGIRPTRRNGAGSCRRQVDVRIRRNPVATRPDVAGRYHVAGELLLDHQVELLDAIRLEVESGCDQRAGQIVELLFASGGNPSASRTFGGSSMPRCSRSGRNSR